MDGYFVWNHGSKVRNKIEHWDCWNLPGMRALQQLLRDKFMYRFSFEV